MLQQREISKLLGQAVEDSKNTSQESARVLYAALLSAKGLPLITVGAPNSNSSVHNITPDSLRMYSLMATNLFGQQKKSGDQALDSWAVLDLDNSVRAVLRQFGTTSSGESEAQSTFFAVLFYTSDYSDSNAKTRLDSVTDQLAAGLNGYRPS